MTLDQSPMTPEPTRIEVGGTVFEVRFNLINNVLPVTDKIEGLLNTKQAAAYLGVHVETLRKWVRSGKIPRIPLPGKGTDVRFSRAALDNWTTIRTLKGRNSLP
jgi:excisionase family DNA binding protein